MAHRLDAVAVGIPEERRIIRGVIAAQARRAVIATAIGDAGIPERIDLGPPFRLEAPVATGALFRPFSEKGEFNSRHLHLKTPVP